MSLSLSHSLSLGNSIRSKGGGAYDPLVALDADLLEVWDALLLPDRLTLNGSEVVTWTSDKSGLAPTQATQTARPLYSATAFVGTPCIVTDGVAQMLTAAGVGSMPVGANSCEIWVLGSQDTPGSDAVGRVVFGYGNGGTAAYRDVSRGRVVSPSSHLRTRASNPTATLTGTDSDFTGPFVSRSRIEAEIIRQWLNGIADGEIAIALAGTGTTRTRIGAFPNSAGANFWNGKIAAIYVTNLLSEAKGAALQSYLMQRAGFPEIANEPFSPSDWVLHEEEWGA